MSSPKNENEEPSSSSEAVPAASEAGAAGDGAPRPPAKRRLSSTVIEISDTESDDSDVCAVTSYQASADEVKRIRGADHDSSLSSSSSSSDYSSDSESPWEDDSVLLDDPRPLSKPPRAALNPRADRTEDPQLNTKLKSQEVIDRLKTHWKEQKDLTSEEVTLTCEPFRLCLLHDLLQNSAIINNIVDDMNTLDWERKKMDLYEFHQTVDLANLTWQRSIKGIYELLKTEVMSWVSEVTGLELDSVSASCSLYAAGDHLLPHDDLLATRRVAFILYLAPWTPPRRPPAHVHNGGGDHADIHTVDVEAAGWTESMGGALELFSRDAEGMPSDVTHRVWPRNNMLAFFQVGVDSFHQVSEVVSMELPRLSINGWFHSARATPPPPAPEPDPPALLPLHNEVVLLSQWVESAYMSPVSRGHVQQQMERESEVSLRDFLQPAKVQELLDALESPDVEWEVAGPCTQRRYLRVRSGWAATQGREHPVRGALQLWASAAFARLLRDCSDLSLAAYSRLELQKWRAGDFTLIPPPAVYAAARLEVVYYCGVPARALPGADTTYLAPEDRPPPHGTTRHDGNAALVTVSPHNNALSLVYCDAGAASFTKYLSKLGLDEHQHFYILTCTYQE